MIIFVGNAPAHEPGPKVGAQYAKDNDQVKKDVTAQPMRADIGDDCVQSSRQTTNYR